MAARACRQGGHHDDGVGGDDCDCGASATYCYDDHHPWKE